VPDGAVTLVHVQPRRTAVIAQATTWADFPHLWGPMLDEVYAFVRECPEFTAATTTSGTARPRWTNVMLYRGQAPNIEVGVLAPSSFVPQGRVIESELPGGRAATAIHHGDPSRIGETHAHVRASTRAQGLDTTGIVWEVYGHPDDSGAFTTQVFHHLVTARTD
jgi:effector-binding domain-containing protein